VLYSVYAMHRDRAVYGADADAFRPERWETLRPGWAYLPFNGGPRICLGREWWRGGGVPIPKRRILAMLTLA
jgi:cytochrome P450